MLRIVGLTNRGSRPISDASLNWLQHLVDLQQCAEIETK